VCLCRKDFPVKLSDEQILALSEELNHLLWTNDIPEFPPDMQATIARAQGQISVPEKNMQCAAHAIVCAAFMCRHDGQVMARAGSAYVVDPKEPEPFNILRHYWITTSDGLMDLSLDVPGFGNCKPVIYQNRNIPDPKWVVAYKDSRERVASELERCRSSKGCAVVYWTENKLSVTPENVQPDLQKAFKPAQAKGIELKYGDIVCHCEQFIAGGQSLRSLAQEEAWNVLVPS
jgi:hypothetical protein